MITINVLAACVAVAVCIPSGIVSFCVWGLEKRLERRQKAEDAKEEARLKEYAKQNEKRQENEYITVKGISAAIALSEATARAVERIPDAHCNGDMRAALEYATKVKHEQKEFLEREGISSLYKNSGKEGK